MEQEKLETATLSVLAVVKSQVQDLRIAVDLLSTRLNNGYATRILVLEEHMRRYDELARNVKRWMMGVAASLFIALVLATAGAYFDGQSKVEILKQHLDHIEQQLNRKGALPPG